jgi:hypothetical protein
MKNLALPMAQNPKPPESCCGGPAGPPAGEHERPGYEICRFVEGFVVSAAGPVPRISSRLSWRDRLGTWRARLGWRRNGYRVTPGLYAVGRPDSQAPVLVTANYKLSFDGLRSSLGGLEAWVLVLDTRGINVWCAAAHQTFSTGELLHRLGSSGLERVVAHRQLILPQLGAPGVSAGLVRRQAGFTVVWGPLRATDLPDFLRQGQQATPDMRRLTFTLGERLILTPVELSLAIKPAAIGLAAIMILSGIGPWGYSWTAAWSRWLLAAPAFLAGLLAGAVLVPALLPWLPFRAFYLKGLLVGLAAAVVVLQLHGAVVLPAMAAQVLLCLAISSYTAMNFTGATPFTSPSGVEKEMRFALPLQGGMLLTSLVLWLLSPFMAVAG